jgi:hypothetical protein
MSDLQWGKPYNARRFHIFDGTEALCSKWWYGSPSAGPVGEDAEFEDGHDCKECCRQAGLIQDGDDT